MNKYNEIHRILKCLRLYSHYTQKELAVLLSFSASYICEVEAGKKEPSFALLNAYSKIYDIPVSTIILFSENYGTAPNKITQFLCKKSLLLMEWIYANSKINS